MEMYLRGDGINFRFPVIPVPFGRSGGAGVDTVEILKKGRVPVYSGIEPGKITLECLFPKYQYSFCNYSDFPEPFECVSILEKARDKGARLRFIVTGTPINNLVLITNFDWKVQDGTGNIYYSLNLIMDDEKIEVKQWIPPAPPPKKDNKKDTKKSALEATTVLHNYGRGGSTRQKPGTQKGNVKTYKVKHGDSLRKISKIAYGKETLYKKIKNNPNNLKKYPQLKKSNVIYTGWVLEL